MLMNLKHNKIFSHTALRKLRRFSNFGMEIADMREEKLRLQREPEVSFFGIFNDTVLRKVIIVGLVSCSSLELTGLNVVCRRYRK